MDGSGVRCNDGPNLNRLPLSTPRRYRQRMIAEASAAAAAAKRLCAANSSTLSECVQTTENPTADDDVSEAVADSDSALSSPRHYHVGNSEQVSKSSSRRPQSSYPIRITVSDTNECIQRRRPNTAPRQSGPEALDALGFSDWPYFQVEGN